MKLRGREKNKFIVLVSISIIVFVLFACFITLVIDIDNNKGIIPIIFFILLIYSIFMFVYNLFNNNKYDHSASIRSGILYLLFFIINIVLFSLSVIALWL